MINMSIQEFNGESSDENRGLLRNSMKELVVKFPDGLRLVEDEGRECGYKIIIVRGMLTHECCEALLFWEGEGKGYYIR